MTDLRRALRLLHPDVRKYLLVAALIGISYMGFQTVLFNLFLLRMGYGTDFIGISNGGMALAFAVCSLPAGALGNRFGPRRVTMAGVFCLTVGSILVAFAGLLPGTGRDLWIVATRVLAGIGFALHMVNAFPYLVAATGPAERPHAFALLTAMPPMAGFAGAIVSGLLPEWVAGMLGLPLTDPTPFALLLALSGVVLVPGILAQMKTQERPVARPPPRTRARGGDAAHGIVLVILFLGLTALLRMAGESAARNFVNVYLEVELGQTPARIGLLVAFGQLVAGPAALAGPMVAARTGKVAAIAVSTLISAVSLAAMAVIPHWAVAGLGFILALGTRSMTQSMASVLHMEIVPAHWRGVTSAVVAMSMGTGFTSMAFAGGYLIPAFGFGGLYGLAAAVVASSAAVFWLYFRVPRGEYRGGPGARSHG
jgi:MFS family permease